MRKLTAYFGLKIVRIGIWLYDNNTDEVWDSEGKANVKKLWKLHDEFEAALRR